MRVIGLTGSIACGKSTVAARLKALGAAVIDGDALSHQVTAPGGAALPALREAFGQEVFCPDGSLNRPGLARIVFSNEEARQRLNGIIHPLVAEMTRQGIEEARLRGSPLCVLDMPLLFEAGLDSLCDRVWCVWLPEELQLQRLMNRDKLTRQDAQKRIDSQLSADEKAARSQVVIDTSVPMDYTMTVTLPALYAKELAAG